MTDDDCVTQLRAAGLIDEAAVPALPPPTNLAIAILQGIGGWLGGLFMLLWVGAAAAALMKSDGPWFVLGCILCAVAAALVRAVPNSTLLGQFALTFNLAGQCGIAFALFNHGDHDWSGRLLLFAVIEFALYAAIPAATHRFISAGVALIAIDLVLRPSVSFKNFLAWPSWLVAGHLAGALLLWWHEPKWRCRRWAEAVAPMAYAVAILTLGLAASSHLLIPLDSQFDLPQSQDYGPVLVSALPILLVSGVALGLGMRNLPLHLAGLTFRLALLIAVLVTASVPLAGLSATLLLVALRRGNRWLTTLSVLGFGWGLWVFYYTVQSTLLEKSGLLLASGLFMLVARWLWRRCEVAQ